MNNPIVSIITPTYNHEKFIGQCIESVLSQTFPNWEQIILDDGSTDSTPNIVKGYKDKRIRYFRQKHRGLYNLHDIYNEALNLANGEFLAILEGDDFWPTYKLEEQLKAFDSNDIILVWGKGIVTDENGRPLYTQTSIRTNYQSKDFSPSKVLLMMRRGNPFTPTSTVMVRKSSVIKIGGFQTSPSRIFVDFPTWLKLASCDIGIFRFVNTVLGYWRTHPKQVTSFSRAQQFLDHAMLINEYKLIGYNSYSRYLEARSALISRNWKDCRRLFSSLVIDKNIQKEDRIISLIGIGSSLVHVDLVDIFLIMRKRLKTNISIKVFERNSKEKK